MEDKGNVSDGYHTFNELYDHRHALFGAFIKQFGGWKSLNHYDDDFPMFEGWFIAGTEIPDVGQVTYHLPIHLWDDFPAMALPKPPYPFDGHDSPEVVKRFMAYWKA